MKKPNIVDISPQGNLVASQISQAVYNRNYFAFIFTLLGCAVLMGFVVSQQYETQKDLQKVNDIIAVNNIVIAKAKAEIEILREVQNGERGL